MSNDPRDVLGQSSSLNFRDKEGLQLTLTRPAAPFSTTMAE